MKRYSLRFPGAVFLSTSLAYMLTLMPLPLNMEAWRPEWLVINFVFWSIILKQNNSLFLSVFFGLLMDVQTSSLMGQHALAYSVIVYATARMSARMNAESYKQQMFLLVLSLFIYAILQAWELSNLSNIGLSYWLPYISSLIFWTPFRLIAQIFYFQRKAA